jgi:hypothetical protein
MSIKPPYAHEPMEPEEPHPMKDRPPVHLCHEFDRRIRSEWILFGMTGDIGARMTSETLSDAVEN